MKYILFLVTVLSCLYFFNGCVPSKPTEEIEILPSDRLLNKLEANRRRIRTFEGSGTISIKTSQINNSASFRIIVSKPDSIYLAIMGPFGIELAQAYVTKESFAFYDAMQNTVYKGALNEEILREIFKINLSLSDLLDAFVGSVNLTDKLYMAPSGYEVVYDHYVLTYLDSLTALKRVYTVDVRELGITGYNLSDEEGELLQGSYSRFTIVEGVAVPNHVDIKNVKENQRLLIDYKNMRANKKDIFIEFSLPDDATVINW